MRISTHVANAIEAAGRQMEREWTPKVQRDALEHGWPAEVVRSMKVRHDDGHVIVEHPDGFDHEFGTQDQPPTPVARQFLHRVEDTADASFERSLWANLRGLL